MSIKRIVQLTDIHFCKDSQTTIINGNPVEAFKQIMASILSLDTRPELIIATGDLSDDGSLEAYSRLQTNLEKMNISVVALPGNHDSIKNMQTALSSDLVSINKDIDMGDWRLLCVDSTILGKDSGLISTTELDWLKQTLNKVTVPCLIALHHSPISNCISAVCQLDNGQQFLEEISQSENVKLVISGHTHWEKENQHEDIQLLTTPSTFLHVKHPQKGDGRDPNDVFNAHDFDAGRYGYRIIDLDSNGTFKSKVIWV